MKRILFITAVIVLTLIIVGLARSIFELWNKQGLIVQYEKELSLAKEQNQALKQKLSVANNPQFVEQQARDNLFLVKPGEQNVIIPQDLLVATTSAKKSPEIPNWEKWWNLFF